MFVGKTFALQIDLDPAFHHQSPGNQDPVGMGYRTMPLKCGHIPKFCAQCLSPKDGISLVTVMSKIMHAFQFRNEPFEQLGIPSVSVTCQDQGSASKILGASIRS